MCTEKKKTHTQQKTREKTVSKGLDHVCVCVWCVCVRLPMHPLAFFIFAEKYWCENGWSTTPRFISFPLRAFWSMILWRKRPERKDEVHEFPVWNVHEAHGRSTAVGRNAPSRTQTIILQVIYSKCSTTWSKSNEFQTYDGAKVKVFARFESESARRRHCFCPGPLRRRSSNFLQARRPRLAQEATMGKVTIFFFFTFEGLSSVWLLFLPTFWHSVPAWDFSWQLTRNVSLAAMLVHSYRRSLDEGYGRTSVHWELKRRGLRSQQKCGHFPPRRPRH